MKKTFLSRVLLTLTGLLALACSSDDAAQVKAQPTETTGKTLVAYYSYTGDCRNIVSQLTTQIKADVVEIQPAEKGLRYEANGYALGTQLLNAIKAAPDEAGSYPAIDPVQATLDDYQNIIIVTPLWWSQMAAIMQSYLFRYGPQMAGKSIALIVSSASSGISQVVADCRRLVPDATWMGDALWINNSNRSRTASLLTDWLATLNFQPSAETKKMYITIDGQTQSATLADTQAARELAAKLEDGPVTVSLNSSGGFEIWGPLGFSLTTSNQQINAQPGDIILYNGSNICMMYGSNSWSYTRLGHIDGLSESELRTFLKAGQSNVAVTLSLSQDATAVRDLPASRQRTASYTLDGRRSRSMHGGITIVDGRKTVLAKTRKNQ